MNSQYPPTQPLDIGAKKLADLKKECADRGLAVSGTMAELIDCLTTHCEEPLPFGVPDAISRRNIPPVEHSMDRISIIVIPGVVRGEDDEARSDCEESLLRAYYRTKPIIMLCGGMWRLTALGATVGKVPLHANSRMVHLNDNRQVVYNTEIHMIDRQNNPTAIRI